MRLKRTSRTPRLLKILREPLSLILHHAVSPVLALNSARLHSQGAARVSQQHHPLVVLRPLQARAPTGWVHPWQLMLAFQASHRCNQARYSTRVSGPWLVGLHKAIEAMRLCCGSRVRSDHARDGKRKRSSNLACSIIPSSYRQSAVEMARRATVRPRPTNHVLHLYPQTPPQ